MALLLRLQYIPIAYVDLHSEAQDHNMIIKVESSNEQTKIYHLEIKSMIGFSGFHF